ncbi:MAG TPA: hypothetical protein V6C95_17915 [Coleofasciculaceae cyanobacterium]
MSLSKGHGETLRTSGHVLSPISDVAAVRVVPLLRNEPVCSMQSGGIHSGS